MILIILSVLGVALSLEPKFKDCNASQMDFFSHYALGQQNELNNTFDLMNQRIHSLPNVTYNASDLTPQYTIG
jgi:hypothetical protein